MGGIIEVVFQNVGADVITDNLAIRISQINGVRAEIATERMHINILTTSEFSNISSASLLGNLRQRNTNNTWSFFGVYDDNFPGTIETVWSNYSRYNWIPGSSKNLLSINHGATSIRNGSFRGGFTSGGGFSTNVIAVAIPNTVTSIGEGAFSGAFSGGVSADPIPSSVVIPNSVRSIGQGAFSGEPLTSIYIGSNVEIGRNAFSYNFYQFYQNNNRRAGVYSRATWSSDWSYSPR